MRPLPIVLLLALSVAGCGGKSRGIPVTWEGTDRVGKGELAAIARRELESFQQRHRRSDLADAAYAMEARLHDRAHPHGTVAFDLIGSEAAPQRVVFRVKEGPRARLDGIDFPGQRHGKAKRLREFYTANSGVLGIGPPLYRPGAIDGATRAVERVYLLAGFYRVEVGPVTTRWNAARDEADLTVPIAEGALYRIAEVVIRLDGHPELDPGVLRGTAALVGEPFHVRQGQEAAARVRGWLLDRGYVDARVESEAEVDDAAATAVITLNVIPGPLTVLRRVVVINSGNNTSHRFVRHHIPLRSGQVARREPLDDGLRYLYRSGLFTRVDAAWRRDAPDATAADLELKLDEARTKRIDFLAGYGSYEGVRGDITLGDSNLFGYGVRGEVGVSASQKSRSVQGSLGYDIGPRDGVDLSARHELREEPSFEETTSTVELSYHHDFTRNRWFFNGPARLTVGERFGLSRAENITGAIDEAEFPGNLRTSTLFSRLRRDTRNSPLVPSEGSLIEGGVAWSSPLIGADLDFLEYSGGASGFLSFNSRTVGAIGARYVTKQILDGRSTLPIQERLFLGGDTTVRSFRKDKLGPSDADNDPLGGLTSAVANVEVRWQALGAIELAGFYDLGAVGSETWKPDRPPGQAIGAGVRYVLPVGPIRFDAAYNPGQRFADDRAWAYHLSVGLAF